MIRKSSIMKLINNEKIRITTPAANDITNKIGFEILKRYAKKEGFENLFIDQNLSPYPNFSALEFITSSKIMEEKGDVISDFIKITEKMSKYCKENYNNIW